MSSVTQSSAIFITAGSVLQSEGKLHRIASHGGRSSRGDRTVRRSFVPQRIERSDFRRRPDLAFPSHKSRSHGVAMMAHKSAPEGDPSSKAILDSFLLGRALAETITERLGSALGEALSEVSKRQAEQNEQVRQFQEEVKERAAAALVNAIKESTAGGGPKPSLAYGSTSSRAASDSTSTQPSPSDTSPRTPNKRVPIVPAEGLDTSSDS